MWLTCLEMSTNDPVKCCYVYGRVQFYFKFSKKKPLRIISTNQKAGRIRNIQNEFISDIKTVGGGLGGLVVWSLAGVWGPRLWARSRKKLALKLGLSFCHTLMHVAYTFTPLICTYKGLRQSWSSIPHITIQIQISFNPLPPPPPPPHTHTHKHRIKLFSPPRSFYRWPLPKKNCSLTATGKKPLEHIEKEEEHAGHTHILLFLQCLPSYKDRSHHLSKPWSGDSSAKPLNLDLYRFYRLIKSWVSFWRQTFQKRKPLQAKNKLWLNPFTNKPLFLCATH